MQVEEVKKKLIVTVYVLGLMAIAAVVLMVLIRIQTAVILLSASVLLAYLIKPVVSFFAHPITLYLPREVRWRKAAQPIPYREIHVSRRGLPWLFSILVVYLLLFTFAVVMVSYVVPLLAHEFKHFATNGIPELGFRLRFALNESKIWLMDHLPPEAQDFVPDLIDRVGTELNNWIVNSVHTLPPLMKGLLSMVAAMFLVPIITFYMLLDLERLRRGLLILFPTNRRDEMVGLLNKIDRTLGQYIRGQFLVAFIIGMSIMGVLRLWSVQYYALIGFFAGVIALIPYAGAIMGMLPAAIAASAQGPLHVVIVIFSMYLVHVFEGKIVVPNVVGRSVGLPPLLIIASLLIGFDLMGPLGMLVAVPTAAISRVVVIHLLEKRNVHETRLMRLPRGDLHDPVVRTGIKEEVGL